MPEKEILIVHPNDNTTSFLGKIKDNLLFNFRDQIHHFNIHPNDKSHEDCLLNISSHSEKGFIIFLGHGRSDKLFGAKSKDYGTFASPDAINENPEKYYYNDDFINLNNIDIFKGKKVFCLACNSNEKVAHSAIEKGAKTFFGFGDIPTSPDEFIKDGMKSVSNDIVKAMKTELNYIIKTSLVYSISKNHTFEDLNNVMSFIVNQRISDILINQKDFKDRFSLTDYLYFMKKNIKVLGNKKLKLIE